MSRALYGNANNGGAAYYTNHLNALKDNGIITNIDPTLQETRGLVPSIVLVYVMLMLMRAGE